MKLLGKFKCEKCGFKFETPQFATPCILCNHKYVKWLNYEEIMKKIDKEEKKNETR
jgi:hypothetical protein